MKIIYFILIALLSNYAYTQEFNTEVIYKVIRTTEINADTIKNSSIKNIISKLFSSDNDIDNIRLKLKYNNSFSFYNVENMLNSDSGFSINPFKIELETRGSIYTNIEEKISYSTNENLPNTYIQDQLDFNWLLTKEMKIIEGFTCFKATGNRNIYKRKTDETVKKPVIAWYCPEINVSTGPSGYGALPGLIMELSEIDLFTFVVSEIKFNLNEKNSFNSKYKIITREEYNNKMRKHFLNKQ